MFNLAYAGKGFTIDLTKVPDAMLFQFDDWFDDAMRAERAAIDRMRSGAPPA